MAVVTTVEGCVSVKAVAAAVEGSPLDVFTSMDTGDEGGVSVVAVDTAVEGCAAALDVVPARVSGLVVSPAVEAGSPELLVPAATAVTTAEPPLLLSGLVSELTVVVSLVSFSRAFSASAVVRMSASLRSRVQTADSNTFA